MPADQPRSSSFWSWPSDRWLPLVMVSLLAGACGGPGGPGGPGMGPEGGAEAAEEQATPVLVTTVERGTIRGQLRAASTIEAELQVTVHAESTGRLTSLTLQEGDEIALDDVIARIRRDAQSIGFERAETSVADAEREFARVEKLYQQGYASQADYDSAKSTVDKARLDKRDRGRDLSNTVIKAPMAGIVTQRFVDPGAFVTNGAQVVEITDFSSLVARVYVPEKELDRLAVGQLAEVVGKAAADRKGSGTIKRIAPVVDATTGTVKITIALPESLAGGAKGFLPGMYAEVTMTTEVRENVPLVPKPALVREDELTFVFVAEGDRAKKVRIELGLADDDFVEITSGIEPGARIIVAGQSGLKDGGLITEVDAKGNPIGAATTSTATVAKAG
jgi:membrane fusion protein (multidrug efflux system)